MSPPPFVHEMTCGRVVFGAGALARAGEEAERLGAERALLIGGRAGFADQVAARLGDRLAGRVGRAVQHVPVAVVRAAAETAARRRADLLVSVGGGSATGLAKAVALRSGLPILAVPTTYAGSEMSPIWGVTRHGRKTTGRDPVVLPRTVVYDPEVTLGLPPDLTAVSGLNAVAHAVEALYAPERSPILRMVAVEAVRALASALPRCVADGTDREARSTALYGAWLAGLALGNATMGLHHRLAHVLGGTWNLPHGPTHAVLLPYVVAGNAPHAAGDLGLLADALGADDPVAGLWELARSVGAPAGLRELGFPTGGVDEAVRQVLATPPVNPAPVTEAAVRGVLTAALDGAPPGR